MAATMVESDENGTIVLPQSILSSIIAKTKYTVEVDANRIVLRPVGLAGEPSKPIALAERLDALLSDVINGIWAFDIECLFSTKTLIKPSLESVILADVNWLNRGVKRFCQQSALLALARVLDKDKDAATFQKFLNVAEQCRKEFTFSSPDEVEATISEHRKWLEESKQFIIELHDFRSKQIAHLDKSTIKDLRAGKWAGFDMEDLLNLTTDSTIVGRSRLVIEEILKMLTQYHHFLTGETFDISPWRKRLQNEITNYAQWSLTQPNKIE